MRGRKPLNNPARSLHIHLDASLMERVDQRLWSDAEQRVPKGAYQAFVTEAIVRLLRQRPFDLAPFAGAMPSEHVVYAFPETKAFLEQLLKGLSHAHDEPRAAEQDRKLESEG